MTECSHSAAAKNDDGSWWCPFCEAPVTFEQPKRYSHLFIVAFTVVNEHQDPDDTPKPELQAALIRRAAEIVEEGAKSEAFQCEDTDEVPS